MPEPRDRVRDGRGVLRDPGYGRTRSISSRWVFRCCDRARKRGSPASLLAAIRLWNYPDGSRIVELSTKCAPTETFQVAAETRTFLFERGVELTGEQQTKTHTALEFFANELKGEAP